MHTHRVDLLQSCIYLGSYMLELLLALAVVAR